MMKKQLIMEEAMKLFAKQGFEATSIQQITDRCGISKGAFYLSFQSKDELIYELIDHFMIQFITHIDHAVKTASDERVLYKFYYATYQFLHEHIDFAKIFITEQSYTLDHDLLLKIRHYDKQNERLILRMIENLYGEKIDPFKYDLMFCVKHFMGMYAGLLMHEAIQLDYDLLATSLVEKTELLANHMSIPFIKNEDYLMLEDGLTEPISKDMLLQMLERQMTKIEPSLVKDSLLLLKEELHKPTLHPALIQGLIENLRQHPDCQWLAYLLNTYYDTDTSP